MWEGVIAGVITFIICEIIRFLIKRSKEKVISSIGRFKRHLKGKYMAGEITEIMELPEDKRTKRQQKVLDKTCEEFKKMNIDIGNTIRETQEALRNFLKN